MTNTGQGIQAETRKQAIPGMGAPFSAGLPALSRGIFNDPWFAGVVCSFGVLAWASWGKLGDLVLDVGHEVEIPARLLAGEVLYRDVQSNYGPFAYYANALALLVFGHQLEVFFAVGMALAGVSTLLVYVLTRRLTDGPWAALCAVCLQLYCIFSPNLNNFIFTYSYGSVYAIALSLGGFVCFTRYHDSGRSRWLLAAAVAAGLACLCKQEYGVALVGSLVIGVCLIPNWGWRRRLLDSALVLATCGIVVFGVLAWFAEQASWQTLAASLFPSDKFGVYAQSSYFQISPLKTLITWRNSFQEFCINSLVVGVALVIAATVKRLLGLRSQDRWYLDAVEVLGAVALATAGLAVRMGLGQSAGHFPHPLAYLHWLLPVLLIWSLARAPRVPPLVWVLLSHALLVNARWLFSIGYFELYSYSAVILFFAFLYWATQTSGLPLDRYLLVCLLVGYGVRLYRFSEYRYPVRSPYGTLYVRDASRAAGFNRAIEILLALKPDSLLVLPEGALLNFLTNVRSPVAEITFLPSMLPTVSAERGFLERVRRNPPDVVVDLHRPFPEWGYQSYAQFNPLIYRWVLVEHRLLQSVPFEQGEIKLYRRRSQPFAEIVKKKAETAVPHPS